MARLPMVKKKKPALKTDELPRGALRAIVLSLLSEKPSHGYAIAKKVEARTGGALRMREGTLYPALHELELDGLIDASIDEVEGRKRRMYRITPKGRREAADWREHWSEMAELLQKLLVAPRPDTT